MEVARTLDSSNIGINIHLLSFSFDKYLIKHDIRGIVMTYPETKKQEFVIKSKDIQFPNNLVTLNISKETQMIFNTSGTISSEIKYLDIYEYFLLEEEKENDRKATLTERSFQKVQEVNGKIEVQITMTEAFDLKNKNKHIKVTKHKCNDHFSKKKKNESTPVYDIDEDEENNSLIPLKEKKSDKKFHKKSKGSKNYINME